MSVKSLNEATNIKCLCDATGRFLNPGTGEVLPPDFSPDDVLNNEEKVLFLDHWSKDHDLPEYVLRVDGKAALGVRAVFSEQWVREVVKNFWKGESKGSDSWMPDALKAIMTSAGKFSSRPWMEDCDIYVGDRTAQGSHEFLVVIPYEARENCGEIVRRLNKFVHRSVTDAFAALLREMYLQQIEEQEQKREAYSKSFRILNDVLHRRNAQSFRKGRHSGGHRRHSYFA